MGIVYFKANIIFNNIGLLISNVVFKLKHQNLIETTQDNAIMFEIIALGNPLIAQLFYLFQIVSFSIPHFHIIIALRNINLFVINPLTVCL